MVTEAGIGVRSAIALERGPGPGRILHFVDANALHHVNETAPDEAHQSHALQRYRHCDIVGGH